MRLKDVCTVFADGDWIESKDQSEEGIRLVQTGNIGEGIYLEKESRAKYISEDTFKRLKCTEIFAGDILVSRLPEPVGRACIIPDKTERMITAVDCTICRPDSNLISKEYLCYFMRSNTYYTRLLGNVTGTTRKRISRKNLGNVELRVPSKEEQKSVVERLDCLLKVIESRAKELQLLDDLIKARFVEMFGDTVTNSMNWEEHVLSEYIVFLTSGSRGWAQYFTDESGEVFITIKNVKNNHINLDNVQYIMAPNNKEAERTKVQAGDLLISITADLGRTGVVDEDIASKGAYINQHLSLVRLDSSKISPLYVSYFLETEGGKRQFESRNQNGVKAGLNFDAIKSLRILVPDKKLQEEYLQFVKQVDKSKVVEIKKNYEPRNNGFYYKYI